MSEIRHDDRDPGLRASDAERERVVEQLREHSGAGRLSAEELEGRIEEAYAARTLGELREVLRELPPEPPPTEPRRQRRRPRVPAALLAPATLLLLGAVAAIVLSGGHLWWIVFPLGFMWMKGGVACGTRRHGRHGHRRHACGPRRREQTLWV